MDSQDVIRTLKEKFPDDILSCRGEIRQTALYGQSSLKRLAAWRNASIKKWAPGINVSSGVDARDHMEILYHFSFG